MKHLLILRHAKSSWKDLSLSDHDRPLNKRGKLAAPLIGQRLAKKEIQPQLVLCSTAVRAQKTANTVLSQLTKECEIKYLKNLYHAYPDEILNIISRVPDNYENLMIVGHNPGLTQLSNDLMGEYYFSNIPTTGIVTFELAINSWKNIETLPHPAKLKDYDYPKK